MTKKSKQKTRPSINEQKPAQQSVHAGAGSTVVVVSGEHHLTSIGAGVDTVKADKDTPVAKPNKILLVTIPAMIAAITTIVVALIEKPWSSKEDNPTKASTASALPTTEKTNPSKNQIKAARPKPPSASQGVASSAEVSKPKISNPVSSTQHTRTKESPPLPRKGASPKHKDPKGKIIQYAKNDGHIEGENIKMNVTDGESNTDINQVAENSGTLKATGDVTFNKTGE